MYRKGRIQWNKDSEKALLLVWSKNISRLRGTRKNSHIVAEMTEELKEQGFEFTPLELRTKIQNLKSLYRKVKRGLKKREVTSDGWDIVKEMDAVFKKCKKRNDPESIVHDSINNITSSIVIDPLSPALNNSLLFPSTLESSAPTSPIKPPDSPLSSSSSDSSSADISFHAAKKKKEKFDKFFENLEQTMEKLNEDINNTTERMIAIEEEKRDILTKFVEKESQVQEALLEFLRRN